MRLIVSLSYCILFNSIGLTFAEDTLSSLQQDVVLAKEKHQAIVGKMENARLALETQESSSAISNTLKEVKQSAPVIPVVPVQTPAAVKQEKPAPVLIKVQEEPKKSWNWNNLNFVFPDKNKYQKVDGTYSSSFQPSDREGKEKIYHNALSDNKVTIEEAVEIAVANNMRLQAAKKSVEVAAAKLTETKRALMPTIQAALDVNGGKLPGGTGNRFYRGDSQKLNFTQPIYTAGELMNGVKQSEENVRVSKAEYKKAKDDIIHQTRIAYYGAVKAEYNAQYQSELLASITELFQSVKKQKESGLISEVDYLNIEAQNAQVIFQSEAAKNDVLSANVSLKQVMDLDVEENIPVDLKMDYVKVTSTFEQLLNLAIENNADLRVKEFGIEASKFGMDIYESKKKPHFELRGSYGMLGEAFHDTQAFQEEKASIDTEKEWFLGVHGSMPLGANSVEYEQTKHVYGPTVLSLTGSEDWRHHLAFNLWDKFSDITDEKQAQYALLQAESEYNAAKNDITLKLRDEFYSLQRYLIQIDSAAAKLKYQDKQLAILQYMIGVQEAGPSSYVDLLISKVQDKYSFVQAVADYNTALSSMGLLIGDPYYFENQRIAAKEKYEITQFTEVKTSDAGSK